ncbi:putative arginine/serine-rich splicing factor [Phyllosticta citriasiana]|uniref:putative arginine/serine-rich splicing factor n=1 Tax=Phyllosticta citriasiana TaxID=595635 RepID=UPI0030FD4F10
MTTRSPPVEPEEFRGQTLTPVSPKPIHYPAPANIPVLEKQMDPVFNDTATHYPPDDALQDQVSNHSSSDSLYADQPNAADQQHNQSGAPAPVNAADDEYARSLEFEDGQGADNQDTSKIESFAPQPSHIPADAPSDAAFAPSQAGQAASYQPFEPYPNATAASNNQASVAHGGIAQEPSNGTAAQNTSNEGGVDFQALLDNLSNASVPPDPAAAHAVSQPQMPAASAAAAPLKSPTTSALPGNPNLPPRPPPQEKPATHPNYTPGEDIRSYHPHAQKNSASTYRNQSGLPPLMTSGAQGTAAPGLPATGYQQNPASAMSQRTSSPSTPKYRQRESVDRRDDKDGVDDSDVPWGPEVQKLYDEFLQDERVYVTEGQWDKFPPNSRLFIGGLLKRPDSCGPPDHAGNLPTEKVTKRDLFHLFHRHGKLAQISIKQAYGFVQFLDAEACLGALQAEQGQPVRGRKIHLEISKPQRSTRNSDTQSLRNGARRRSRSPDYSRGGTGPAPRNVDRYTGTGGPGGSPRRDEFRRGRDDYRPGARSPSPRGYRRGGRDRSRDRYDGRRRSRSRSPYGRGSRYRSPSPRSRDPDDDLPLPRRLPRDVPDVQILVLQPQEVDRYYSGGDSQANEFAWLTPDDRTFIAWVERTFQEHGIRCDVLLLSPRLDEAAVVRRQILEGVHAVSRITHPCTVTGKIPLQVFNRSAGAANVTFEEYENLDVATCAHLIKRSKDQNQAAIAQSQAPAFQVSYGMPPAQYGMPPQQPPVPFGAPQQPVPGGAAPDVASLISNLDSDSLQKLLATIQQPGQQPAAATSSAGVTPDLSRLLGGAVQPGQPQAAPAQAFPPQQPQAWQQHPPPQPGANPFASLQGNPALAAYLGGQQPGSAPQQPHIQQQTAGVPPSGKPDMQEIMAQLAKYRR